MSSTDPDFPTMLINGTTYAGLIDMHVARAIDHCASDFEITVAERWLGQPTAWMIKPFDPITIMIGPDVFLTGYVDSYEPQYDGKNHQTRIRGRSKTEDLVDCKPDIAAGQFSGYSLQSIALSICGLFGLGVTVDPSAADAVTDAVADATIERGEAAFTFLERLGRLSGVLLCDTPQGNLLLTSAGTTRATGALKIGSNVEWVRGKLDVHKRFSAYIVKGQSGIAGGAGGFSPPVDPNANVPRVANEVPADKPAAGGTGVVQNGQVATATDAGVPRYRPHVSIAESQLPQAGMQQRANWQMHYAYGRSIEATVRVKGYRQADGTLWTLNQIVPCSLPQVGLDQDLLLVKIALRLNAQGGRTAELTVSPQDGYTPDAGQVRLAKHKSKHGGKGHSQLDTNGNPAAGN